MVDITIVSGVYKPTNITGGHHPVAEGMGFIFCGDPSDPQAVQQTSGQTGPWEAWEATA